MVVNTIVSICVVLKKCNTYYVLLVPNNKTVIIIEIQFLDIKWLA